MRKICALDVDNNDTWLLQMENLPDGTIGRVRWALLKHVKQKPPGVSAATRDSCRDLLEMPGVQGSRVMLWGARPQGNNGNGSRVTGNTFSPFRNSSGKF